MDVQDLPVPRCERRDINDSDPFRVISCFGQEARSVTRGRQLDDLEIVTLDPQLVAKVVDEIATEHVAPDGVLLR